MAYITSFGAVYLAGIEDSFSLFPAIELILIFVQQCIQAGDTQRAESHSNGKHESLPMNDRPPTDHVRAPTCQAVDFGWALKLLAQSV